MSIKDLCIIGEMKKQNVYIVHVCRVTLMLRGEGRLFHKRNEKMLCVCAVKGLFQTSLALDSSRFPFLPSYLSSMF